MRFDLRRIAGRRSGSAPARAGRPDGGDGGVLARRPAGHRGAVAAAARSAVEPLEGRTMMTTVTLNAAADAYVRDGTYASANYGSDAQLQVKTVAASGFTRDAYLRFATAVPAGNVLQSATLRVYGQAVVGGTYTGPAINDITLSAFPFSTPGQSWSEGTVTWNGRPLLAGYSSHATALAEASVTTASAAWRQLDLTSYVAAELAANRSNINVGLHVVDTVDAQANLNSDEASANRPELVLTYAPSSQLVLSGTTLSVPEGSSASLNVKLPSAPAANVTVTVGKQAGGDADLTSSTTTLTFTPANWNAYQPVTVAAAHDADTSAGTATFNLSATGYGTASFAATEAEDDVALAPTADAFVRDGTYAATNFGTDTSLEAKSVAPTSYSRTSYLKFDLTSAPAAVGQAKLRVYGSTSGVASPPLSVSARKPTTNQPTWAEGTINWNNKPALAGTALSSVDVGATAGWYELDVTAYVQAERAAGRNALTLGLTAETKDMLASLVSREGAAGTRPQLVVLGGTVTSTTLPPTVATAAAATPNPVTGTSAALSVLGADDGGETALIYTWQVDSAPAGAPAVAFGASGTNAAKATTATFGAAGTYVLRATIADALNQTVASTVTVTVAQTLTSLTVQPDPAPTLAPFGTATFGVAAADQFGSPIATPPAVTWTATGGTVDAAGLFTAGAAAGGYTVTATSGSASDGVSATVVNAAPTLDAAPTATLGADGKTVDLHVRATDDGGPGNLTYTWAVTPPSGVAAPAIAPNADVTANDASTTLSAVGTYAFTVTVADASGGSTTYPTAVSVTAAPVLTVTPGDVSVAVGKPQAFTVADQFGQTYAGGAATWSVAGDAGGTITSTGVYTAPAGGGDTDTVTAAVGSATATARVRVTGLRSVLYYPFSAVSSGSPRVTADDAGDHDGVVSGANLVSSGRPSYGNALSFDGVDDYVVTNDDATGDLDNTAQLTISMWVNPDVRDDEPRGLIAKRNSYNVDESYAVFVRDGYVTVDLNGTNDRFSSASRIPVNAWTHVVVTYDGTLPAPQRAKIYLDGILDKTSGETSDRIPDHSSPLYVGMLKRSASEVSPVFSGMIDDVRVFRTAVLKEPGGDDGPDLPEFNVPHTPAPYVPTERPGGTTGTSYTADMLTYLPNSIPGVVISDLPDVIYYGQYVPINAKLNYRGDLNGVNYNAPRVVYQGLPSKAKMFVGSYSAPDGGWVAQASDDLPELFIPRSGSAGTYTVTAAAIGGSAYATSVPQHTVEVRDGPPLEVAAVDGSKTDDTADASTYGPGMPATPLTLTPVKDPVSGKYYARIRVAVRPQAQNGTVPLGLPGYILTGLGNQKQTVGGTTVTVPGVALDPASEDPYVYRDLMPGRTYKITLSGQGGSDPVDYKRNVTVVVLDPADKRMPVVATAAAGSGVKVDWLPTAWGVTGYAVERTTDLSGNSGWSVVSGSPLAATATSYTDGSADAGTAYVYRVRIYRDDGIGTDPEPYYSAKFTYQPPAAGSGLIADLLD